MDLIQKALVVAYDLHKGTPRKGGDYPYFVHLLDVAKYVMYETQDESVVAAALLHDTIEDVGYTEEELREEFNDKVAELVLFCTEKGNTPDKTDAELKASWKERKTRSIEKLGTASRDEVLVFVADKVSNLLSVKEDLLAGKDVFSLFRASKEDVEWYYREVYECAQERLPGTRLLAVHEDLMKVF